MIRVWHALFAQGLWQSTDVIHALSMGFIVSVISGVIGIFVVVRGQSFVGHVLTDIGAAGASGAFLLGINAWYGFLSFGMLAGLGVDGLDDKIRNRDVPTGIVLSFAMGLGVLFLYFDTRSTSNPSAPNMILFGSLFTLNTTIIPIVIMSALVALFALFVLYRPLLLSSVSPDIARSRGIPVRAVSVSFMILLAIAVEDSALIMGALLSTALIIGSPAAAMRLTSRLRLAMFLSALVGSASSCIGVILAYDSYFWTPSHQGWPVSSFVAFLVLLFYALSGLRLRKSHRPTGGGEID